MAPVIRRAGNTAADVQTQPSSQQPDEKPMRTLCEDELSTLIVGVLTLILVIAAVLPFLLASSTIAALLITAIVFATWRHVAIVRSRSAVEQAWRAAKTDAEPDTSRIPALYFTYVLGSGGHTGELAQVIKQQFKPSPSLHRRYIITSGDTHSANVMRRLEAQIQDKSPPGMAGTWDVYGVIRARKVHQPLYTAWFTSILSSLSIVYALIQEPVERRGRNFSYPHVIVTNGPGTGFIVCLVAHLLKVVFIIPPSRAKMVYIETWAHLTTLSLTGKLFHYTGLADVFIVQHKGLAEAKGKKYVGEVAKTGNLVGVKE